MTQNDTTPPVPPEPAHQPRSWIKSATLALFAVSAVLGGTLLYTKVRNPLSLYGTAYAAGTPAPTLAGTGEDGQPLALSDLKGKTVAVFFGFLHCPDFCPTTLAALERVRQALPKDKQADFVPLLVSVDPKRDTVASINEYVKFFNPQAKGMRIPEPQLSATAKAWGAGYQYSESKGPREYEVSHTTGTYLVDKAGKLRLVWDYTQVNTNTRRVAQDVLAVME
ncbi:electron transport protein SCO1/SenC (plasmid) [Deinococcus proteolyticus MRP]|uniref:Electron transport protein SCO1/SenC n=2 Tax=Deinococcus TaxID=1298 RepID=F0RQI6_DEIPM|nr:MULTISPECIES: SCO family protein [Deinococcus]ADY27545.1 electron transport protein SCO1/SenC [Deinococcus proteolyticus MRP]MCY1704364.1 SCO family protein [Deinococcus sp. SL84]UFA52017.1 SCO family protein [Deinococcus radiophilus]GHG12386.1 hypothetical protein GCM10017783_25610 [Deinococcus piscis]